jgi:alginate O-acetyltransferase complex protein AlgJ
MSLESLREPSPLDREKIAHIEVGHTNVSPALARGLVVWFLLTIAALPIFELAAPAASARSRVWAHLAEVPGAVGERLAALDASVSEPTLWSRVVTANRALLAGMTNFEDALEDASPVGRFLRPPTQAALSRWLGAGNEQVYIGRDGWLFYRPDVEYVTGRGFLDPGQLARRIAAAGELQTPPQPDPRAAILQLKRDLDRRGITLVVMPTPVKPTVHPGQLAGGFPSASAASAANPSYASFIDGLRRDGVIVFDPVAEIGRSGTGIGLEYLATDTHWRPEAGERVAAALASFLREQTSLPPVPAPGYRIEPREARQTGDTAAMLDLPRGQTLYPPERVVLRFVVGPDGDPWRPSRDADVLVLGDSFSNVYSLAAMGWGESAGFVEHLSYALQRPVDRIVQNDQASHATRAMLQREMAVDRRRLDGTKIIVWQFAARELAFGDWRLIELPPPDSR